MSRRRYGRGLRRTRLVRRRYGNGPCLRSRRFRGNRAGRRSCCRLHQRNELLRSGGRDHDLGPGRPDLTRGRLGRDRCRSVFRRDWDTWGVRGLGFRWRGSGSKRNWTFGGLRHHGRSRLVSAGKRIDLGGHRGRMSRLTDGGCWRGSSWRRSHRGGWRSDSGRRRGCLGRGRRRRCLGFGRCDAWRGVRRCGWKHRHRILWFFFNLGFFRRDRGLFRCGGLFLLGCRRCFCLLR